MEALDEAGRGEPRGRTQQQAKVRRAISIGARLSTPYLVMNALATIVAAYGLLADSAAVVIGAMIIAMLLGPIMGLALAIVDGDTALLRRALLAEAVGAGLVFSIGIALGTIHRDIGITSEILARTKPNLLDLFVALAGGAAGAYATVSPRVSVGLVGVAISTALVPPLTACGICVSRGLHAEALGAFILFATNLVAIQCASSAVLFLFGYHELTRRQSGDRTYVRRLAIDGILFVGLAVFLYFQLARTIRQQQYEEGVKQALAQGLRNIPGAHLAETKFRTVENVDVIVALVRVPNSITPQQTAALQALLPRSQNRRIELHVRAQLTKETTAEGYLHEIAPNARPADDPNIVPSPTQSDDANQESVVPSPVDSQRD